MIKLNTKSTNLIKFLVFILGMLGPFCAKLYLPSLPAMTQYFQVNSNTIQLTVTFYLLGFAVFQLIYGPLSDRYGRRPIAILGLIVALLASMGCYRAASIDQLIFFRLLQGIGFASSVMLMRSIMRDVFSGAALAQAMSYVSIAFAVAPLISPLIGGYVQESMGWHMNFMLMIILLALAVILIFTLLPETNRSLNPNATQFRYAIKNYSRLISHKIFLSNLLCAGLAMAGAMAYTTAAPILFQHNLGLSPSQYGWIAFTLALVMVPSRVVNALLLRYFTVATILSVSILLMLAGGISMLIFTFITSKNIYSVLIPMVIFVFGSAMVFPNTITGALTPFGHISGSAAALYGCIQMFFGFVGSGLVAVLSDNSQLPLAAILTLLSILSLVVFYYSLRQSAEIRESTEAADSY